MKFAFYNGFREMLVRNGADETAEFAERQGFSSVEMLEGTPDKEKLVIPDISAAKELKNTLRKHGLGTSCYSVGTTLWSDAPVSENTALSSLLYQLEITAGLDCPLFHHTLFLMLSQKEGVPDFDTVLPYVTECAAIVADRAKELGITCIYEDQGFYFNGEEKFGKFYSEIKKRCKNVGVCGDYGNIMFVDEKPENFFSAFRGEIKHVHVKDFAIKDTLPENPVGTWYKTKGGNYINECPPGKGDVDFAKVASVLKSVDYAGTYSLEFNPPDYSVGFGESMEYLKKYE